MKEKAVKNIMTTQNEHHTKETLSEYNRMIVVGKLGPERYVEAHVWSDEPICRYH